MKNIGKSYSLWINELNKISPKAAKTLSKMSEEEINNGFADDIQFGTGGLRGVLGLGPNKINVYTVRKVTKALCEFHIGQEEKGVVIAFDTRRDSDIFSYVVANTFLEKGYKVYLFKSLVPIAILSYTIPKLDAICGVMITASHNPSKYNGYKVYDKNGTQVLPNDANKITDIYNKTTLFDGTLPNSKLIIHPNLTILGDETLFRYQEYIENLLVERKSFSDNGHEINIIYSPIYGTGYIPIKNLLSKLGFSNVRYVQTQPDSNFGGLRMPNPESMDVYSEALKLCETDRADIIFSTDPDCDRVGVLVNHKDKYISLSGNQLGALMLNYIIESQDTTGGALITTIVSGGLAKTIARENGLGVYLDLTGFKFIGHRAHGWQTNGGPKFIFGYEESYGYLTGDEVHDKDGVISSMLICAIALKEKLACSDMYEKWLSLCSKYGYFIEDLETRNLPIIGFRETIAKAMDRLRQNPFEMMGNSTPKYVEDYDIGKKIMPNGDKKPLDIDDKSDVLKFFIDDDNWVAVRPSGTEPKIKLYFAVKDVDEKSAKIKLNALKEAMVKRIDKLI